MEEGMCANCMWSEELSILTGDASVFLTCANSSSEHVDHVFTDDHVARDCEYYREKE